VARSPGVFDKLLGRFCYGRARTRTQAGRSVPGSPRSRIDLDRGGHAGDQANAVRYLIDPDAHGHALSKAHPSENRVDSGKPLLVGLRVRDVDTAREAADLTPNDLAVAHQFDPGRIAFVDGGELCLLEIGIHPEGIVGGG
jgi:hypothetical protein